MTPETTDILWRSATVQGPATDEEKATNIRKVLMVSRTGNTVRRRGWDTVAERYVDFDEELIPDGFRAAAHVSFLDSHRAWSTGDIIGHVVPGSVRATEDGLEADIELDQTDRRAQKILAGHAGNVSVGYEPGDTERIDRSADGMVPLMRVKSWDLRELSSVAVGADSGAVFRCRGLAFDEPETLPTTEGPVSENTTPTPPQEPEARGVSAAEALQLRGFAESLGLQITDEEIAAADSYERKCAEMLAKRHTEQLKNPGPKVAITEDESDKRAASLKSDLFTLAVQVPELRRDAEKLHTHELFNTQLRGASMRDMCVDIAQRAGMSLAPGADFNDITERLFGREPLQFRGPGPTGTTNLPNLLADVMHNVISVLDLAQPGTYEQWSSLRTFSDFRAHNFTRLDEDGGPELVLPGEEVGYGYVTDGKESITAAKYGKAYAFTLEVLVNDMLGGLMRYAQAWAARWRQKKNVIAYTNLLSNPTMSDGNAFFHSSRGNIIQTTAATLPNPTAMAAMDLALANQTNANSETIAYDLGFWLTARTLRNQMALLMGETVHAVSPTSVAATTTGPLAAYLRVPLVSDIQLDRLAAQGANYWYAVAPEGEPFIYGSVQGQGDGVETYWNWERQCRIYHVRGTFAHGAHNPRAMVWNTGVDLS